MELVSNYGQKRMPFLKFIIVKNSLQPFKLMRMVMEVSTYHMELIELNRYREKMDMTLYQNLPFQ